MKVVVVGLGLIGGSICKAFQKFSNHFVTGIDENEESLNAAVADGAIIKKADADDLEQCDLCIVALWPDPTIEFITQNAAVFKEGAIVADVCGVKDDIVYKAAALLSPHKVHFIGTHPMAGIEFSGYAHSFSDLFLHANLLITPAPDVPEIAVVKLEDTMREMGFGTILRTTPAEHDRMIAFTSQLAHVVSNAYVKSPSIENKTGFTAGSFLDLTRVAKLNEYMWSSLFLHNKEALLFEIDFIIKSLEEYRDAIAAHDEILLQQLLRDGRIRKENSLG